MVLATWLLHTQVYAYPLHPDLTKTPSSLCSEEHSDFTEYRYDEEIPYCKRNVSTALKEYIYQIYKIPKKCRNLYTIDHFIPLSIGGDNSIENLWPEHKEIKADRPQLEWSVYQQLASGQITHEEAIDIIYFEKTTYGSLLSVSSCD